MGRIRGKHTEPEVVVRQALWSQGFRYRLHRRIGRIRPDLVFGPQLVAVFIDGCFWHGCPDHYVRPRSRDEFWSTKLASNVDRDRRQTAQLELDGWRVCRIWEHEVFECLDTVVGTIVAALTDASWLPEPTWRVVRVDRVPGGGDHERRVLELLREDPPVRREIEQVRHTRKWRRTADATVSAHTHKRMHRT